MKLLVRLLGGLTKITSDEQDITSNTFHYDIKLFFLSLAAVAAFLFSFSPSPSLRPLDF